ncbi:hypothetical protein DY000_02050455 [Brassica cretica]|uniref:F-box domain-containing protein n=1 Tax=Brassica cretica TaxID=69181 RepID=A0ABQ7F6N8_BRACR|nr:hypothetical protein DY000_02050455 [Brassica cretica]
MSKLSTELLEEILSRVPMTSMRSVRCTCRNWNTICKDATFTKKHLSQTTSKGEILTVVMMNCSLHLMRVNLQRGGLDHPTIKTTGYDNHGVSLKGNTYWYAKVAGGVGFLLCFDFTRERFGPLMPLPFECFSEDAVILSSVGEEQQQLAVLFQHRETFEMEVWVTTKVEPDAVSWSMFFAVDMGPLTGFRFNTGGSFVVDEENAAVVVFDEDRNVEKPTRNTAYIAGFGESSYFREVDLGKITTGKEGFPHACSYVPSSVQTS